MRIFFLLGLLLHPNISYTQIYETNAVHALAPEDCSNGLDDDGDGYVDCYDVDCQCFDPPACSTTIPPNTGISMKLDWKSPPFASEGFGGGISIIGNMNPQTDNIPEIVATQSNNGAGVWDVRFFRGDGSNASASDTLNLVKATSGFVAPLIGDVDNDGIPELIVTQSDSYIRVYRNFTPGADPVMSHWITASNKTQSWDSQPMLADMDGDGTPEIVMDNEVFIFDFSDPANAKLRKVLDGGNNNPSGKGLVFDWASPAVADLLTPADCNGDPDCNGLEIAAGPAIYSIDLDTMDGDGYQIKIQRDLNLMESPDAFTDGYTAVADMNIDGIPDIVVLGKGKVGLDPDQVGVYVWNKNGLVRFMNLSFQDANGLLFNLPMIANVFDDTKRGLAKDFPEIVFSTPSNLYCFNLHATNFPNLSIWWFLPMGQQNIGTGGTATAFDFNGDGLSEIVFCDNDNLRIIYGGHLPFPPGVDADRNWATAPFYQGAGGFNYPVVADVDNDGQAEIIQFGNTNVDSNFKYVPTLYVYGSAGIPWPACRNLWNQYNYNIVNVNDDLSIPAQQQQHWKEFPAPGSGKRPLNMALGQRGPLNGAVLLPLADLNSGVDTFYCDQDSLRLRLRVCNGGSVSSPAGLSLQWYQGNPTAVSAAPLGAPYIFPSVIAKDSCAFWNLALPLPPNGPLYGIINDNGSVSGPINLAADFPSTSLIECDYLDNLFSINVSYSSPTLDLGPDQSVCKDATLSLTASPGFSRYRWQDGSQNATFTATGIGTYWVDAWDICGNLFSDTLRLLAIPTPPLALGPDASICLGGSITLAVAGFDHVDWASAGTTVCAGCPSFTISPAADVAIHVSGQSGVCVERDTISITVIPLPQISGQAVETHCGNADGSINILINSALPYQIQWSGGQTVAALSGLAAATYGVTVTDDAGCTQMETYAVAGSTAVVLDPEVLTNLLCFGEQTGGISASINSGTAPYQFNWSTGVGSDVLNGLSAGNYSLTVTDALGCTTASNYQLTEPPQLIIQYNVDGTSCTSATADISLVAQGGTSPYNFAWNGGQNTPALNDLPPGAYTVSVTDANGCQEVQAFDIHMGGSPVLSTSMLSPVVCFGENTGAISVEATLGESPYQFNWSTGPGTNTLNNLAAGTYDLTVTDANGCTTSGQYSVTEPPLLLLLSTVDSTSCISTTANVSVVPQGGTSPYNFNWNGGQDTPILNDLPPGTYTVSVTDANGCETVQVFDIQIGGSPVLNTSMLSPVLCFGENTGAISVDPTLGESPYQFNWSTGSGTNALNNLTAGNYDLTVTDANGCTASGQYSVTEPPLLQVLSTVDSTSCTSSTGNISVSGQGGTAPLAYSWNGGQNTPAVNNLNPGTYTVTVSDANGCTMQQAFTLAPGGAPVLADSEVLPVTCSGETNGQITVDVNGGVAPYQFQWSTGSVASVVGNLPAGDYTLTATGANGCFTTVQFTVTEPAPLALSATVDSTSCTSSTGNISVTPQGGISPYNYLWSSGQNLATLMDLPPGDYSVTTTDLNGCSSSDTYTILPGGAPELTNSAVMPVTCFGESNGGISVQVTGGGMPYQFNWSAGQGNEALSNLLAGTYQLTISDANACTSVAVFTVETPAAIDAALTIVADTCGQFTGSISVNTSGGITPYSYLWSDGQITEDRVAISAGTFQLTVTDSNGCTFTKDTEVFSVDILPQFSVAGDTITCVQSSVELRPNPAPANWVFEWQAPDGALLSGANQTFNQPGQYHVTAINDLGCTAMQLIDIPIDTLKPQAIAAASDLFIPCDQSSAVLDGSGSSTGAFFAAQWYRENNGQIVWDTMAQVAQTGIAGTFILQITNLINGCTDHDTVQVTVAHPISDVEIGLDSISCFGLEDGVIRVESVSGGLAPYLYSLDNKAYGLAFTFTDLTEGSYTLFVQDANGCDWQSAALLIGEPVPLSLNLTASDTRIDQGEAVVLQAQVHPSGAVLSQIQWSPPAYFSLPVTLTETVQPTETTLFQIEVEDANGCSVSDTARVRVRREAIYVPNVFYPGSPDNDQFTVFSGADILEVQLLRVYDRWGELLFEHQHFPPNDPGQGWDGTYRGQSAAPGVYVYYVVVEIVDGRTVELKGSVTVVR